MMIVIVSFILISAVMFYVYFSDLSISFCRADLLDLFMSNRRIPTAAMQIQQQLLYAAVDQVWGQYIVIL